MTYEKLSNISLLHRKRQERNKDVLAVTTGEKGDGKSNYIMQQARDYLEKFGLHCLDCDKEFVFTGQAIVGGRDGAILLKKDMKEPCYFCKSINVSTIKKFNFFTWMAYDAAEVESKIMNLPPYSPLLSDELARFALAENWNNAESKEMKKLLIQCRTKKLIIMGNIPDFITLDKKYRNMSNYWVRILQRDNSSACAIFIKRSKGEFDDKYHMKELQELLGDYFEDTPMDEIQRMAMKIVQKHPCVEDWFMIPPMPKDMYEDYEVYRNAKVFERREDELVLDDKQMAKVVVYNLMNSWKDLAAQVEEGRYERPSLKMIENVLARNPVTGNALVRYTTIRNWIKDVEGVLRHKKSILEKEEVEVKA